MAKCEEHGKVRSACPVCSPETAYRMQAHKAKKRGWSWTLTLEQFEKITAAACKYCGENPGLSVDRIDSRLGYYVENVAPADKFCNQLKSNFNVHDWLCQILKIAAFQNKEKIEEQRHRIKELEAEVARLKQAAATPTAKVLEETCQIQPN
jgi:hypothetical protein